MLEMFLHLAGRGHTVIAQCVLAPVMLFSNIFHYFEHSVLFLKAHLYISSFSEKIMGCTSNTSTIVSFKATFFFTLLNFSFPGRSLYQCPIHLKCIVGNSTAFSQVLQSCCRCSIPKAIFSGTPDTNTLISD